jgi:hypothetical protein
LERERAESKSEGMKENFSTITLIATRLIFHLHPNYKNAWNIIKLNPWVGWLSVVGSIVVLPQILF